jgi:hypothetical protein
MGFSAHFGPAQRKCQLNWKVVPFELRRRLREIFRRVDEVVCVSQVKLELTRLAVCAFGASNHLCDMHLEEI